MEFNGPEELVEHGTSCLRFSYQLPPYLQKYLKKEGRYKLNKREYEKAGIYSKFYYEIVDDFAIQDWYTKNFDYSYLTNRDIDIDLINAINNKNENIQNKSLMNGLTHLIPVFGNLETRKILDFRIKNIDLFNNYRFELNKIVKERKLTSQSQFKEAFYDLVKPNIEKIDMELKNYKKSIVKDMGLDVIVSSGLVVIGLYSGILPSNIGEIIATVGGVGGINASIKKGLDIGTVPNDIRANPYFFLWKLQRKNKKSS